MIEPRLVVGALIVDSPSRPTHVLAARRTGPTAALAGRWEFPGGKVDDDETPVEALKRELYEELGLIAEVAHELVPPAGIGWPISSDYILRLYYCTVDLAPVQLDGSHDEVRWVGAGDLEALEWLDADRQALPYVFDSDRNRA